MCPLRRGGGGGFGALWPGGFFADMGSLASELADMAVDRLGEAFATSVW